MLFCLEKKRGLSADTIFTEKPDMIFRWVLIYLNYLKKANCLKFLNNTCSFVKTKRKYIQKLFFKIFPFVEKMCQMISIENLSTAREMFFISVADGKLPIKISDKIFLKLTIQKKCRKYSWTEKKFEILKEFRHVTMNFFARKNYRAVLEIIRWRDDY